MLGLLSTDTTAVGTGWPDARGHHRRRTGSLPHCPESHCAWPPNRQIPAGDGCTAGKPRSIWTICSESEAVHAELAVAECAGEARCERPCAIVDGSWLGVALRLAEQFLVEFPD